MKPSAPKQDVASPRMSMRTTWILLGLAVGLLGVALSHSHDLGCWLNGVSVGFLFRGAICAWEHAS